MKKIKILLAIVFVSAFAGQVSAQYANWYEGGCGTGDGPYCLYEIVVTADRL